MEDTSEGNIAIPAHHIRQDVSTTRPKYRQGKRLTAVKVYTVNDESTYLLIHGVPTLDIKQELLTLCSKYGTVLALRHLEDYPHVERFTEVHLIKYGSLKSARYAKRKLDECSFFGGALHVCYAPEYESLDETRSKLQDRRKAIAYRCQQLEVERSQCAGTQSTNPKSAAATNHTTDGAPSPFGDETNTVTDLSVKIGAQSSEFVNHNSHAYLQSPYCHRLTIGNANIYCPLHEERTTPYSYTPVYPSTQATAHLGGDLIQDRSEEIQLSEKRKVEFKPPKKPVTNAALATQWYRSNYSSRQNVDSTPAKSAKKESQFEAPVINVTKRVDKNSIPYTDRQQPDLSQRPTKDMIRPAAPALSKSRFVPRQVHIQAATALAVSLTQNSHILSANPKGPALPDSTAETFRETSGQHVADSTTLEIRNKISKVFGT